MNDINIWLISGFFGSGKTTFLKRVLEDANYSPSSRTGVIVNEFGKASIDGTTLNSHGIEMKELNNGSIFCSCLKGNFIKALSAFLDLQIKTLFVECSGMADPSTIMNILAQLPEKTKKYIYRGTISTVDAELFPDQIDLLEAAPKQISFADVILITKKDLATEAEFSETLKIIKMLNDDAKILTADFGETDLTFFNQDLGADRKNINDADSGDSSNRPDNRPLSYLIDFCGEAVSEGVLKLFLSRVSPILMRCKGFVTLTEKGLTHIDAVGEQISLKPAESGVLENRLVLIGARDKNIWEKVRAAQKEVFGK